MNKKVFQLLSLLLALSLVFTLAACSSGAGTEETTTTEPAVISKSPKPDSVLKVIDYFNKLAADVKKDKPAVSPDISQDVGDFECENDTIKAYVPTLKKEMLKSDAKSSAFGEDAKDSFPLLGKNDTSVVLPSAVRYAQCLETAKTYEIIIPYKDEANAAPFTSGHGLAFDMADLAAVKQEFDKAKAYMTVDFENLDLLYTGSQIKCSVDKATDRIISVTYSLNVLVKTAVTGVGTLEAVGTVPVSFRYSRNATYNLDWTKPEA